MNRQTAKRILFWLILALFLVSTGWWCFYFPYHPERMQRAIPANAHYVGRHVRPAERWREMLRHPAVGLVLQQVGLEASSAAALTGDPDVERFVNTVAAREAIVAYVPNLGRTGRPGWVAASWMGARARLLAWTLRLKAEPPMVRHKDAADRDIWSLPLDGGAAGGFLSMTVAEGVWLGCLSDDPTAVRVLLERLQRGLPIADNVRAAVVPAAGDGVDGVDDREWLRWDSPRRGIPRTATLRYALGTWNAEVLAGRIQMDRALAPRGRLADVTGLDALPGPVPQALVLAEARVMLDAVGREMRDARMLALLELLAADMRPDSPFFAALYGGEQSGRILGVRAPTLAVGWRVRPDVDLTELVNELLDGLNAVVGWTLIPRMVEDGPQPMIALDTAEGGIYSSLPADEKPAVGLRGDWLVLASNLATLRTILSWSGPSSFKNTYAAVRERALERADRVFLDDCACLVWADAPAAAQAARNALAVYSLSLLVKRSDATASQRARVSTWRGWVAALEGLGESSAWIRAAAPGIEADVELRAPARPAR